MRKYVPKLMKYSKAFCKVCYICAYKQGTRLLVVILYTFAHHEFYAF